MANRRGPPRPIERWRRRFGFGAKAFHTCSKALATVGAVVKFAFLPLLVAALGVAGGALALPEPEPVAVECLTADGRTVVYPVTAERPEECYEALSIQLSVSPNPPRRTDIVTFTFTVSPGPTDCHDSFGNIFNHTSGAVFQRGIADQSDPFSWEVTCIGNGWESRRITVDIVDDAPPPATCRDGVDNEGDGYIDWGVDPDCLSADDAENVYDSSSPPPPPPPSPCAYEAPVKLYADVNGGGECWPFAEGRHDAVGIANDRASYVWIQSGYRALLCTDVYLQGSCTEVSGSSNAPWGPVLNDSVSSVRVERAQAPPAPQPSCNTSAAVVLYEHANYTGRCRSYDIGEYASLGDADNQASSIRVSDGLFATVFADPTFAGGKNTLETSPDASSWTSVGHGASSLIVFAPESLGAGELLTASDSVSAGPQGDHSDRIDASGCWRVWDGFAKYAVSGRHAFSMKLTVNGFCTNGSRITQIFGRERWEERPRPPFPFNLAFGWEFRESLWDEGDTPSPENRPRLTVLLWKGDFMNCVFEKGCLPSHTYHGWIRMELRGNGAAYCTNSVDSVVRNCAKVRL